MAKVRKPGTSQAAANAARSKAVLVKNIETGETVEYVSQSAAARALGVGPTSINSCLKRKNRRRPPAGDAANKLYRYNLFDALKTKASVPPLKLWTIVFPHIQNDVWSWCNSSLELNPGR